MNDSNDSRSTRALDRARLIAARAQNGLSTVTRRFYQEFWLANHMSSEDMSRRVIGIVGRMTSHLAIIFVSVLALTLAGLRLGAAPSSLSSSRMVSRTPAHPPGTKNPARKNPDGEMVPAR